MIHSLRDKNEEKHSSNSITISYFSLSLYSLDMVEEVLIDDKISSIMYTPPPTFFSYFKQLFVS